MKPTGGSASDEEGIAPRLVKIVRQAFTGVGGLTL
jgi:hypothetical protein